MSKKREPLLPHPKFVSVPIIGTCGKYTYSSPYTQTKKKYQIKVAYVNYTYFKCFYMLQYNNLPTCSSLLEVGANLGFRVLVSGLGFRVIVS
jgi:hypothetical protein